jgi:hypothetical protein
MTSIARMCERLKPGTRVVTMDKWLPAIPIPSHKSDITRGFVTHVPAQTPLGKKTLETSSACDEGCEGGMLHTSTSETARGGILGAGSSTQIQGPSTFTRVGTIECKMSWGTAIAHVQTRC